MGSRYPYAAGPKAQPEIKQAVERFKSLPENKRKAKSLLTWLLGPDSFPYKASAEDCEYTKFSDYEACCNNCEHLSFKIANRQPTCSQIQPYVDILGWCNRWASVTEESNRERDKLAKMDNKNKRLNRIAKDVIDATLNDSPVEKRKRLTQRTAKRVRLTARKN